MTLRNTLACYGTELITIVKKLQNQPSFCPLTDNNGVEILLAGSGFRQVGSQIPVHVDVGTFVGVLIIVIVVDVVFDVAVTFVARFVVFLTPGVDVLKPFFRCHLWWYKIS
jgi:hypothetical protein